MGAELADPARRPVSTCRGGNPAMVNTEASEVRSGMFAPPQCPADWLMVGQGGWDGGTQILRGQGLTAYMWNTRLRAGRAGLGKLLSLTSSHGVKILRQTPGVNCQIMSSTSLRSLRFHCKCLNRLPLSLEDFSVVCMRVCKYIKCVSRCVAVFEVCLPEQLKQNRIMAHYCK